MSEGCRGKLSWLVFLAPCPGFGSGSVISQFFLLHNLGIFSYKRYKHYISQTEMFTSNVQFGYPCRRTGVRFSRQVYLAPTQDLGQAVSSVNSYCTIILEYLFVWDINIISVKLRGLNPMFSLVTFVRVVVGRGRGRGSGQAVQACLSWPRPGYWSNSVIS